MKKGKLIVIEGASDGIGKTTQYELLKKRLEQDGEEVICHHFPTYHSMQGKLVEEYLQGNFGKMEDLSPYFINSLYAVDRAVTWQKKLKQAYLEGKIILLDRYTTSSLIYQTSLFPSLEERKAFIDFVIDFEYEKLGIQKPDGVIFLDASFEQIASLRKMRNYQAEEDIHEKNLAYLKKVYENAHFVAEYLSWFRVNCSEGDHFRSKEEIHEEVYRLVKKI